MTAVVAAHAVAVPAVRKRLIDRDQCYHHFSMGRSLVHSRDTCAGLAFRDSIFLFFEYKKLLG